MNYVIKDNNETIEFCFGKKEANLVENKKIIRNLFSTHYSHCSISQSNVGNPLFKYTLSLCKSYGIPVYLRTSQEIPKTIVEDLIYSPDNEIIVVLDTLDSSKTKFSSSPEKLLGSLLNCFHNGLHSTLFIPDQLNEAITEYDVIHMISLFKNWIHLISLNTDTQCSFSWDNILEFITENKIDVDNRKEV